MSVSYVFLLKNSREQATCQRFHFAMSHEGFGKGMNTFFPDSSNFPSFYFNFTALTHTFPLSWSQCLSESVQGVS